MAATHRCVFMTPLAEKREAPQREWLQGLSLCPWALRDAFVTDRAQTAPAIPRHNGVKVNFRITISTSCPLVGAEPFISHRLRRAGMEFCGMRCVALLDGA